MSIRARRSCASLLIAAYLIAGGPLGASAQQLQADPGAPDASGSVTTQPKAKRAKAQQSPRANAGASAGQQQQQGGAGNRQFGELEGWSPGKAPPGGKPKEEEKSSQPKGGLPIGVSPSGNMSVGLPF
ncbi:hypothetical protein HUN39_12910 [Methylocystis sp. FS]|uniref:hypothetical protein n=1 Tax=Methylocystis silviterrae TaxID=2743612 RepID=UPI0015835A99|nr:hypothetical protein [Methylocystis silviterrae]NUJ80915.1 hypothetical protein [Methylocystis silviterrae]